MLGEEVLRRRGSVGSSVEIDLRVAESAKDVGQIGHRGRGRVLARIRDEPPHAGRHVLPDDTRLREVERAWRARTVETVRAAGSSLVDEHDVAALVHLGEDGQHPQRVGDGRAAGPARDVHQRIRSRPAVPSRNHRHAQLDRAAFGPSAVLRDGERLAPGRDAAVQRARSQVEPRRCGAKRDEPEQSRERNGQADHASSFSTASPIAIRSPAL